MIRPWGILVLALYAVMILVFWVNMGQTAEYATYMRVVGHDALYVQVVDEDGQAWDVKRKDDSMVIDKGDIVMVVMDLQYQTDMGVFMIGYSHIEDILQKGD